MSWWIAPFFIVALLSRPIGENIRSYLPFFISFIVFAAAGCLLGFLDARFGFWTRAGLWKRGLILVIGYAATAITALLLTIIVDYYGLISYFGGDAAGSFGLLYIPSIIFYAVAGGVPILIFKAAGPRRGK